MTKVINPLQALRLAELTEEILQDLPTVGNEIDCNHSGNMISIKVGTEYGNITLNVAVQSDDTATSVHQRFIDLLDQEYDYREGSERFHADNYESASQTQGYAFDSLTC